MRHGESIDNKLPVFQSSRTGLNRHGVEQAQRLARRLSNTEIDLLFSSTLPRAVQTAEIIAEISKQKVIQSKLFIERVSPNAIQGKPRGDKDAREIRDAWKHTLLVSGVRFNDGENYDDIIERVDNALDYLRKIKTDSAAVVTHGYFIRAILARILHGNNITPTTLNHFQDNISLGNTSITTLQYAPYYQGFSWKIESINDLHHLEG